MNRYLLGYLLFSIAGAVHAGNFYGDGNCPSAITSSREAADKADWIMEGTLSDSMTRTGSKFPDDLMIEDASMIRERDPRKIGKTMTLEIGPCIAGGRKIFQVKTMYGKRYRFYGVRHAVSPLRRIFFMEPVEKPMPSTEDGTSKLVAGPHANQGEKQLADGWRRARSTEGGFAVDLPGEIFDATKANGDAPGFVLCSTDQYGSTFIAVFERSGRDAGMHSTYDQGMEKALPEQVLNFRGYPALFTKGTLPNDSAVITRSLFIRVPGGTYMLGLTTSKSADAESVKNWTRFYNSLSFN